MIGFSLSFRNGMYEYQMWYFSNYVLKKTGSVRVECRDNMYKNTTINPKNNFLIEIIRYILAQRHTTAIDTYFAWIGANKILLRLKPKCIGLYWECSPCTQSTRWKSKWYKLDNRGPQLAHLDYNQVILMWLSGWTCDFIETCSLHFVPLLNEKRGCNPYVRVVCLTATYKTVFRLSERIGSYLIWFQY